MSFYLITAEYGCSDDRAIHRLGASTSFRKAADAAERFVRCCASLKASRPPQRARNGYHWARPGLDEAMAAATPLWSEYDTSFAPDDVYVHEVPTIGGSTVGEYMHWSMFDARELPSLTAALNELWVEKQISHSQISAAEISRLTARYGNALIRKQTLLDHRKLLGLD
jgi:hypothetical protein